MTSATLPCLLLVLVAAALPSTGQRITTIQLDGVQYFVSRMNPYSPELNYFLAYQYCRSLGLQLASFETKEKADSITTYLTNAGYNKYDFWTSGNNLGTDMFLWMSTGLPFNATFNYMRRGGEIAMSGAEPSPPQPPQPASMDPLDVPQGSTAPQRTARHGTEHILSDGCVALKAPTFHWEPQHCGEIKDFICEQTRCYYYNYGSIPVSSAQGKPLSLTTTTTAPPLSSSSPVPPRSEHLPTHFTLNDLLGKLRPSSLDGLQSPHLKAASALAHKNPPTIDGHYSGINHHDHAQDSQGPNEKGATSAPSTYDGDTDVNDTPTRLPVEPDNSVDEEGSATLGPYNHSADLQMGDDPNAYAAASSNSNSGDDYVSTIEPDIVTTYKSETMQKIAGKVLAAPSY